MNVIGFAQPSFQRPSRRPHFHRVETVTLASSISIIALLTATGLHVFASVAEEPLVVGTIVLASIAGWINAFLPSSEAAPGDGGSENFDGYRYDDSGSDLHIEAYDRAA